MKFFFPDRIFISQLKNIKNLINYLLNLMIKIIIYFYEKAINIIKI